MNKVYDPYTYFSKAEPVYPVEKRMDSHSFAGFYAVLDYHGEKADCKLSASAFYKLYVNGSFVCYGPARAAHEYARVDTPDITPFLRKGENHIAIEVVGYCGKVSLADTGEAAFMAAQIELDGIPVLYTGDNDQWKCFLLEQKVRTELPFSHARFWVEEYNLTPSVNDWRMGENCPDAVSMEVMENEVHFLPRVACHPDFSIEECIGSVHTKGIRKAEMTDSIHVLQAEETSHVDFDFGVFHSGFLGIEFTCDKPCTVCLMFQEKISRDEGEFTFDFNGETAYTRSHCTLHLSPGTHRFETFEAYAVHYLRILVEGANSYTVHRVYVRRCHIKDLQGGGFLCSDGELNRIYRACRKVLVMNTFDAFMDCAQRERGSGWNDCSYWCSFAQKLMLGDLTVEKCYLENQIKDTVRKHCDMPYACYPANYRCIIHNWTIYLLIQLGDYYRRSGDDKLLKEHMEGIRYLVDSLNRYRNAYGLLENLPEIVYSSSYTTSMGNDPNAVYNQPISTITNMMFARAIAPLGEILEIPAWTEQAQQINRIMEKVIAGIEDDRENQIFPPSSIRMSEQGEPESTDYFSEGGLYFWAVCGFFNVQKFPRKFKRLIEHFGPKPLIPYSHDSYYIKRMGVEGDLFARIEMLCQNDRTDLFIREIKAFLLWQLDYCAGLPGEGWDWYGGNHHSFGAFYGYALQRQLGGLDIPDEVDRCIQIAPKPCGLKWAESYTSSRYGICSVKWTNADTKYHLHAEIPEEYTVCFTIPKEVVLYGRKCTLNGEEMAVPVDGKLMIKGGFDFVSEIL